MLRAWLLACVLAHYGHAVELVGARPKMGKAVANILIDGSGIRTCLHLLGAALARLPRRRLISLHGVRVAAGGLSPDQMALGFHFS